MTQSTNAHSVPYIPHNVNYVMAEGRKITVALDVDLPRIVVLQQFLSDEECDQLVELAKPKLLRSNTVDATTGVFGPHPSRTSTGMFFGKRETPLIALIEQRIATVTNWPEENGEGMQILRYDAGNRYLPHNDYFDENSPVTKPILERGGNRVGTFLMYLATPEQGGATIFPESGIRVQAIKGNAVFFSYSVPNATTKTLHGGDPVITGEKYVATKWIRQRKFI